MLTYKLQYDEIYTLPIKYVTDNTNYTNAEYTKINDSGWTIKAFIHIGDSYAFIDKFIAYHVTYGTINADSINENVPNIKCESEEAYEHFIRHHTSFKNI